MKLNELPHLTLALEIMGVDNGANVNNNATIPQDWEMRCHIANAELSSLKTQDMLELTQGEEEARNEIAKTVPVANEVLVNAFDDGPLTDVFFTAWTSIYEARKAEESLAKKIEELP